MAAEMRPRRFPAPWSIEELADPPRLVAREQMGSRQPLTSSSCRTFCASDRPTRILNLTFFGEGSRCLWHQGPGLEERGDS